VKEIASFIGESRIGVCFFTPNGKSIVAVEVKGNVHILRLENILNFSTVFF
jgi:hypothetical protein